MSKLRSRPWREEISVLAHRHDQNSTYPDSSCPRCQVDRERAATRAFRHWWLRGAEEVTAGNHSLIPVVVPASTTSLWLERAHLVDGWLVDGDHFAWRVEVHVTRSSTPRRSGCYKTCRDSEVERRVQAVTERNRDEMWEEGSTLEQRCPAWREMCEDRGT